MPVKRFLLLSILVSAVLFGYVPSVKGVVIPLDDSGWAMVVRSELIDGGYVSTPSIFNFEPGDDEIVIGLGKTFQFPLDQEGLLRPITIEFQKLSSDAVSTIVIEEEYIINNTDIEWIAYDMFLMVNVLTPQAGFNPDFIPDGDQLESVSFNEDFGYGYNGLPTELNFVNTDGGGVPPEPVGDDVFQPGHWRFGGRIVIEVDPQMQVNDRFQLQEIPIAIPEPATIFLLGGGYFLFFAARKKSV